MTALAVVMGSVVGRARYDGDSGESDEGGYCG